MKVYLNGKVISTSNTGIVFESNNKGIFINMKPNKNLELFKFTKVFVYEYLVNNYKFIYGFLTLNERSLFIDLLRVSKIGPKIALNIVDNIQYDEFKSLFQKQDVKFIKSKLGLSEKLSLNIMIDLATRYIDKNEINTKEEIKKALQKIGYKKDQIDLAISKVDNTKDNLEKSIKDAIRIISSQSKNISNAKT